MKFIVKFNIAEIVMANSGTHVTASLQLIRRVDEGGSDIWTGRDILKIAN
jgi:hypothetical protein